MTFWRWVLKVFKNLLLKNLQVKTRVENVWFLSWRIFFVGKYGIQSANEMAFKRTVTLRASFRFPAIRFDAPTLLSFSGFTHAHAKCPPVHSSTENSDEFYFLVPKAFGLFGQRGIKSPVVPVVLRRPCFSKNESQIFHWEREQEIWGTINWLTNWLVHLVLA